MKRVLDALTYTVVGAVAFVVGMLILVFTPSVVWWALLIAFLAGVLLTAAYNVGKVLVDEWWRGNG